jgi:2-methylcitrate dehydratase PrpD
MQADRPPPDDVLVAIADYAKDFAPASPLAFDAARAWVMDALATAFAALKDPARTRLLGPVVRGATMNGGSRVPGTSYELDPVKAAFDVGAMVGGLAADDVWLAPDTAHPFDTLGGPLAVADWLSRRSIAEGRAPPCVRDLLAASIKAHEIHGATRRALAFERSGFDSVVAIRLATAAVATAMLGGTREHVIDACSNALLDGAPLRAEPGTSDAGSRSRWAAADATSRGVRLALLAIQGANGWPSALTAAQCGFEASLLRTPLTYARPLGTHEAEHAPLGVGMPGDTGASSDVETAARLLAQSERQRRANFEFAVAGHFPVKQAQAIVALFADPARLDALPVHELVSATVTSRG